MKHKLREMTLLGVLSIAPVTFWLIRNYLWMRTTTDRNLGWHPPGTEVWTSFITTIFGWLLPKNWIAGREMTWLTGFVIIGAFCLVVIVYVVWKKGKVSWKVPSLELLFVTSIIVYMVSWEYRLPFLIRIQF